MRSGVSKKQIIAGVKRVNITLHLKDFDDLNLSAEFAGISPTAQAASFVIQQSRIKAKEIHKSGYVPLSQIGENLFTPMLNTKKKKWR